jgi:hypothetical protein
MASVALSWLLIKLTVCKSYVGGGTGRSLAYACWCWEPTLILLTSHASESDPLPTNHVLVSWQMVRYYLLRQRYSPAFWKTVPAFTIKSVPDELLVETFNWCPLDDEYSWNHRRRWFNLSLVC